MLREDLIYTCHVYTQTGRRLRLEYYRLEHGEAERTEYGAAIRCTSREGEDYAAAFCITILPERIDCLLRTLARCTVTPVTLRDVLDDFL